MPLAPELELASATIAARRFASADTKHTFACEMDYVP